MNSLRNTAFYCVSDKKKKAVVDTLISRGEPVAEPTTQGKRASDYPYVIFRHGYWQGYSINLFTREVVTL